MKIRLAISPCPNDTFIFGPLIHHWIDTQGLSFETIFRDVQALNLSCQKQEFDICKVSFAAYPGISEYYRVLTSGAALGRGCGPLLVFKDRAALALEPRFIKVGIPGTKTTANALLSMAYPELTGKVEMIFSDIEPALIRAECDLGLLIHEKRFTYREQGLQLMEDLGIWWERETGEAIPLGCIAIQRNLKDEVYHLMNQLIKDSIRFSFANPGKVMPFVASHADDMNEQIMKQHISLYVNDYSLDLGKGGIFASETFFRRGSSSGLFETVPEDWLLKY